MEGRAGIKGEVGPPYFSDQSYAHDTCCRLGRCMFVFVADVCALITST